MLFEDKTLLYMGFNYTFSPPPHISKQTLWALRSALTEGNVDYGQAHYRPHQLIFVRQKYPLEIKIITSNHPEGQLLIVYPAPKMALSLLGAEAEAICDSFQQTWPHLKKINACRCKVHYLLKSDQSEAFAELWEGHLNQSPDKLAPLGLLVKGGGLRFMLETPPKALVQKQVELKIESYLHDPSQIFLALEFKWAQADELAPVFSPADRLQEIDTFVNQNIKQFFKMTLPENSNPLPILAGLR